MSDYVPMCKLLEDKGLVTNCESCSTAGNTAEYFHHYAVKGLCLKCRNPLCVRYKAGPLKSWQQLENMAMENMGFASYQRDSALNAGEVKPEPGETMPPDAGGTAVKEETAVKREKTPLEISQDLQRWVQNAEPLPEFTEPKKLDPWTEPKQEVGTAGAKAVYDP